MKNTTITIALLLLVVLAFGCKKAEKETSPIPSAPVITPVTTSDIDPSIYEGVNDTGISDIEITDADLDVSLQ
ncbi:MAG TPA: hypothetical protein VI894_01420 [Candidatus Nanoarchaeia archaeon]|nr:hypothetical protein [Candidatus Nanoarchaeia archaeon]